MAADSTQNQPQHPPPAVRRGLSTLLSSQTLQERIWKRSLSLANRFRVIRTLDIAVYCFPERGFKAALTAAQRAVRGLVKAQLLRRYKTDRHMTVYGLTQRGAAWLTERGIDAAASVRRVSDMSNPEHRLWAQFLVLCAEARHLKAMSETELMRELCVLFQGKEHPTSLLDVTTVGAGRKRQTTLRPDAVCYDGDDLCWIEVDRSARGADRAASLRALALSMGSQVKTGQVLRTVVVYTRNDRIRNRVLATLRELAQHAESASLQEGRRQLREAAPGSFEVWVNYVIALGAEGGAEALVVPGLPNEGWSRAREFLPQVAQHPLHHMVEAFGPSVAGIARRDTLPALGGREVRQLSLSVVLPADATMLMASDTTVAH